MSVAIVSGVGESQPQRRSNKSAEALVLDAIAAALLDAGVHNTDIDAVVLESSVTPQLAPIDHIAPAAGLVNLRCAQHSMPVGAGILAAVGVAFDLVNTGKAEHCLVYFGIDWGTTPDGPTGYHEKMPVKRLVEMPAGFAGPPLYFAAAAQRYQYVYGLSDDELQEMLWNVVHSTLVNASKHPGAQNRKVLTRDEYLNKAWIAEPLRSADCSLLSDGAVALVISRRDKISNHKKQSTDKAAITLSGWGYDMDPIPDVDFYTQSPWLPRLPAASRAAERAFRNASLSRTDISVFEVYDCFSIAVILQLEAIGLCEPGEGKHLCAGGALRFDGRFPTNTHGGLLGHGYLLGAGHVVEAIRQLQHQAGERQVRDARHAFVGAGPGRQYTALILSRQE